MGFAVGTPIKDLVKRQFQLTKSWKIWTEVHY